ncbi:MAG: glycerol kinase GlpK [Gemmatimonadetes bacterium]|nr:glycerol kinase GlpK [Gemmatimonadota bacterium]
MKSVLALDEGTTGATGLVVSEDGAVLGRGYREFTQFFPEPGWVEHDAEEIFKVTLEAGREAIAQSGVTPTAIGITNQRETVVVWDRSSGKPLHRALVWQDRRTAERCRELKAEFGSEFLSARTGLTWDPYFSATKIEWLVRNVPEVAAGIAKGEVLVGTIDAWLIWRLTNGRTFATDHSNASRTMLYNLESRAWDPELLELFGVPEESLPSVGNSSGWLGDCAAEYFGTEIPIAGVAGDQQAALYGQGCWTPGKAKCTYGTGAFLLFPTADIPDSNAAATGLLTTVACAADGSPTYAVEGSVFIAGAAIQWLRDGLGLIADAAETEKMARTVLDTGGVYFVPAFVGLGAPHWEADARGTIVGITRGTSREHIVRAGLEAMAYGVRELLDAVVGSVGLELSELRVDGGAAANGWLMQFQADILDVTVLRPDLVETTALGAAGLAGIATGVWDNPEHFIQSRTYTSFTPNADNVTGYEGWQRAVATTLHWARYDG